MGSAGCVVCHSNHAVLKPSDKLLSGPGAVCAQCHDAASAGGQASAQMGGWMQKLNSALERSDALLNQAARSGMEVSEALLQEDGAREALVKARVAVHAFQAAAVAQPAGEGLKIAAQTYQAGENALRERQRRRIGLGFSLLAIAITLGGLWVMIRRLEKPST
jgi:predicted CXXCH cytochrome family protein